jgi:hypothetical protein
MGVGRVSLAVLPEQAAPLAVECGVCEDCPPAKPTPDPGELARASIATDLPLAFDESALDPAVNATLAFTQNVEYWNQLGLEEVRPLRGIEPAQLPVAYANRVVRFQRMAVEQTLDTVVLGQSITPDGVLGPITLLLLRAVATEPAYDLFRTDVTSLGFSLDRLRELGSSAQSIAELALPAEVVADWGFKVTADKMIAYYEAEYTNARLEDWQAYFAPTGGGEAIEWPHVFALLRRLLTTRVLSGRVGVVRFRRAGPRQGDSTKLARRIGGSARMHVWWDLSRRFTKARKAIGFAEPTAAAKRAFDEIKYASAPPYTRPMMVIQLPEIEASTRQALFDAWFVEHTQQQVVQQMQTEDQVRAFADSVMARLPEARSFAGETEFSAWFESNLRGLPVKTRTMFFDAMKTRGELATLWRGFGGMVHSGHRSALAAVVEGTPYVDDADYKTLYIAEHQRRTNGIRKHRYDYATKTIFLDGDSNAAVIAGDPATGGIVNATKHMYTRDETVERIKAPRLKVLCKQLVVEMKAMLDEVVAKSTVTPNATIEVEIDEKKFFENAVTRAGKTMSPPLADSDIEKVSWELTVKVHDLRRVTRDGIERAEIDYEMVERFGSGHWQPVPETRRWRSEEEFGEELFFLFLDTITDVITVIAYIALAAVAVYILFGLGAGAALIKLAGGGAFVLTSVAISVGIYLITNRKNLTWEGLFEAALMGYLQALGFRAFAWIGRGVGAVVFGKIAGSVLAGTVSASVILRGAAGLLLQKAVTGIGGGAAGMFLTMLATDLVRVVRDGGDMSSWDTYLDAMSEGAKWGLIGELAIAPALSFAGGVAKGTVIHKAAQLLGGGLEKLKGLTSRTELVKALQAVKPAIKELGVECAEGLAAFGASLRAMIADPAIVANGIKAMRARIGVVLDDVFSGVAMSRGYITVGKATKKGLLNVGKSFYDGVLDLAEAGFSRYAARGLRRLAKQVGTRLTAEELDKLIGVLRTNPTAIDPVLGLIGTLDVKMVRALLDEGRLFELANAKFIHELVTKSSIAEVRTLLQRGYGGAISKLEAFSARVLALAEDARLEVMRVARSAVVSPEALIELAERGVVFDPLTVTGLERLTAMEKQGSLAAILRERVDVEGLLLAGSDPTAELALRALLEDAVRAARLLHATESIATCRALIEAAKGKAAVVAQVLDAIPPRVGNALRLEVMELEGLRRLVVAAGDDLAAVRKLLGDPYHAHVRMRAASRASRGELRRALADGAFPPRYRGKSLEPGRAREDEINDVPRLDAAGRMPFRVWVRDGLLCHDDGTPFHHVKSRLIPDKMIYVMTTDGDIFIRPEDPMQPSGSIKGHFRHSSFLAGGEVGAAGEIAVKNGRVGDVTPGSGHYHPQTEHFEAFQKELLDRGVDLSGARFIE